MTEQLTYGRNVMKRSMEWMVMKSMIMIAIRISSMGIFAFVFVGGGLS